MRLFVAVRPPAAACAHLAQALGGEADPRWHVTLAFLGERPSAADAEQALAAVPGHALPLRLAGGLVLSRRVLAVGLDGDLDGLRALAAAVRAACRVEDARPWRPHLTLARGRDLRVPEALRGYRGPGWTADRLELVLSRFTSHEVLRRYPLPPSPP